MVVSSSAVDPFALLLIFTVSLIFTISHEILSIRAILRSLIHWGNLLERFGCFAYGPAHRNYVKLVSGSFDSGLSSILEDMVVLRAIVADTHAGIRLYIESNNEANNTTVTQSSHNVDT